MALEVFLEEMTLLSGGTKPFFRVTLLDGSRVPELIATAISDIEAVDMVLDGGGSGREPSIGLGKLLEVAKGVFEDNPGKNDDFTPYVIVLSSAQHNNLTAQAIATEIKALPIQAGSPRIAVFDFGDEEQPELRAVASSPELYVRLTQPDPIARIIPTVGTAMDIQSGAMEVDALVARLAEI
jgi:hypothetical protein